MKTPNFAAATLLALASFASAQEAAPRYVPGCSDVVFQPEDPSLSKPVTLTSQEWVQDCVPVGDRGQDCWERAGQTDTLSVRVGLQDRKPLLPWESDVFRVCLTGPALHAEVVSAAYDYSIIRDGAVDGIVVFAPGAKRLLPPDPRGVQGVLTPNLTLAFHDQWADYYRGGTVVLMITLKKEVHFWPDETVAEKTITLPAASSYFVELGGAAAVPGGIYYARYSIVRLGGTVSTQAETPALETQRVSYEPRDGVTGI